MEEQTFFYNLGIGNAAQQFIWWTLITAVITSLIYRVYSINNSSKNLSDFVRSTGPYYFLVFLLYGVIFHPPNNFGVLNRMSFAEFWSSMHKGETYLEYKVLFVVVCLTVLGIFFWMRRFLNQYKFGQGINALAALALIFWYLAAQSLRSFTNMFIDQIIYRPSRSPFGDEVFIALIIGSLLSVASMVLTILGRSRKEKSIA